MAEHERVSVTVKTPTLIRGQWFEKGDEVEVYPFQKRHLVHGGYVEGEYPEDVASDAEKEAGALNSLKRQDERDDVEPWTVEKAHEEGYGYSEPQDAEDSEAESQEDDSEESQSHF
jgi:hypothetical protein